MVGGFIMELYLHQKQFLSQNPDKCSLVWSCGTGKTRTAIEWASIKKFPLLIICPKALKANWTREAQKWGDFFENVLTKEEFRRDWQELSKYDQVIVDEVHNGFLTPNFKSQMSKALRKYLHMHKVPRVLLLSATVYTSSPWNIYNLAWYTGHQWDYQQFKYKFFREQQMGLRSIWVPKTGIDSDLAKLTQSIASVVDIKNVIDVPLQNHCEPEYFALTKEQEKAIEDSYDPVPIVRYTYQHEIENGVLIGNEFREYRSFKIDKNERIIELIKENKKVAVICRYTMQINELINLSGQFGKVVYTISGSVKDRDAVTLAAEKAEECVVLIQADCGVGFQLPSFGLCIYASMSYSYTSWEQCNGRFLRMDKPSRTTFMYLLTEGDSIDQAVYNTIKKKEDFQIELYGKI